jgi:hypothetical protein
VDTGKDLALLMRTWKFIIAGALSTIGATFGSTTFRDTIASLE